MLQLLDLEAHSDQLLPAPSACCIALQLFLKSSIIRLQTPFYYNAAAYKAVCSNCKQPGSTAAHSLQI